jgi:hypothetical protein
MHLHLEQKVVDTIQKDISRSRGTRPKCSPLSEIVFSIQAKVDDNDGCHTGHDGQDGIDTQQKAIDMVEFVIPKRRQDVVNFNKHGTETQQSGQRDQARGIKPEGFRYHGTSSGIGLGIAFTWQGKFVGMMSQKSSNHTQRNRHKDPEEEKLENDHEWNGIDGSVEERHSVQEQSNDDCNSK